MQSQQPSYQIHVAVSINESMDTEIIVYIHYVCFKQMNKKLTSKVSRFHVIQWNLEASI